MEKTEYRAVVKFLVFEGNTYTQINERLRAVLGNLAPSSATIKRLVVEFRRGRERLEDAPRAGRPSTAVNHEKLDEINDLIKENRRISIDELCAMTGVSRGSVSTIIHDFLGMSKVSARWVPRMLTMENREIRARISKDLLARYRKDPNDFCQRIITCDETWIHYYDPETKMQSMEWRHPDSPPPRKFKVVPSQRKIMMTIFWDCDGVILTDFLPRGSTINGDYYAGLLYKLKDAILEKRPTKQHRGVLLQQDNAAVHKCNKARAAAAECGFEIIEHPPYSPDLAPSDFYLFPNLKNNLRGNRYAEDNALMSAVEEWLQGQDSAFYKGGIVKLESRWSKCIAVQGDYVEK
jgi:histone-lysine N-methyltransferase SETMAR